MHLLRGEEVHAEERHQVGEENADQREPAKNVQQRQVFFGVYAFDGASGAPLWSEHNVHDGGLLALAIHPDGTSFATAGQDGRVVIRGVADGRQQQSVEVGTGWVEHIAWSQDGRWLAASCSRQVSVFTSRGL